MSTDTQDLSITLQMDYIARYAAGMQYSIVQVYRDEGKTGLTLRHRAGLQHLLADVASGTHGFDLLLIYDVSRWGRFLDIDEGPVTNSCVHLEVSTSCTARKCSAAKRHRCSI
jgi:DNA invertase Pin-like site-specific DNA recombinase